MINKTVNLSEINKRLPNPINDAIGRESIDSFAEKCRITDLKQLTQMANGNLKSYPSRELLRIIAGASEGRITHTYLYEICGYSERDTEEDRRWMTFIPKRGDVYYVDLGWNMDAEQGGIRPVVILQNDRGNKHSSTVVVCPLTSKYKRIMPTHVKLSEYEGVDVPSLVLCEQIQRISKRRFYYNRVPFRLCELPEYKMIEIKYALEFELGFKDLDYDEEVAFSKVRDIKVLEYNMKNKQSKDLIGIWREKWEDFKEYCDSHKVNYNLIMSEYENLERQCCAI